MVASSPWWIQYQLLVGGAWAGKKVFSPALDALGELLASYVPVRKTNAEQIAIAAAERVQDSDGIVNVRATAAAFEDGSWSDDGLLAAYFGGAIAASMSETGEDDAAIPYVKMISRLSANALALHHALYCALYELREQVDLELNLLLEHNRRKALSTAIPAESNGENILKFASNDTLSLLENEGLIRGYKTGSAGYIGGRFAETYPANSGLSFSPTPPGMTLFMVGYGFSARSGVAEFMEFELPEHLANLDSLPRFSGAILQN